MSLTDQSPVMDISPWPHGNGFSGGKQWWAHIKMMKEKQRLDNLLGVALLDQTICDLLLIKQDRELMCSFGLSEETQEWLCQIHADSLYELAKVVATRLSNGLHPLEDTD